MSSEDVLLELAWRRFSECREDKRDIETKASVLLGATGAVIGITINVWKSMNPLLAGIGIALLLSTLFLCIGTLKIRKYKSIGILEIWNSLTVDELNDEDKLKLAIYSTLGDIEKWNRELIAKASKYFSLATLLFVFASVFITVSFFISFFRV